MRRGNAVAWERTGATPALQAHGGTQVEGRGVSVMAGGMPYEDGNPNPSTNTRFVCKAMKKNGEPCESWTSSDTPYCQGHLGQLQKLERKIAACEDEAERLALEDERVRKWV